MHVKLSKREYPKFDGEKEFMSNIYYHSLVGSLMYVMIMNRARHCICTGSCEQFLANHDNNI